MRRGAARVALLLATTAALLVGGASAAAAHADLRSTNPTQSAVYPSGQPPVAVSLRFTEAVTVRNDSITVYRGGGATVAGVKVKAGNFDNVQATLPKLADGSYVVLYRVVSDDGHPEQGALTFTVGKPSGTTANIGGLLSAQAGSRSVGIGYGIVRALAFLGTLVFVGGLCFVRWCWPTALTRPGTARVLGTAALVGLLATLAALPFQAAYGLGGDFGSVFSGDGVGDVVSTRLGNSLLVRAALIVVLLVLTRVPAKGRASAPVEVLVGLLGLAVTTTFAFAGHGYTGRWKPVAFGADIVHLIGVGLWFGGLVVLAFALRRDDRDDHERRAADRFSALALPAIVLVVLSGVVQAFRQIGGWDALLHTTYARLLVVKVLVVIAVIVIASAGRDILKDRAAAGDGLGTSERRELRTGIWLEVWLAIVIFSLTAALVNTAPAREAIAATKVAVAHTLDVRAASQVVDYRVQAQPAVVGMNTLLVTAVPKSANESIGTITGKLTGRGGLPPIAINFTPIGNNRWIATPPITSAGTWTLDMAATMIARPDSVRLTLRID